MPKSATAAIPKRFSVHNWVPVICGVFWFSVHGFGGFWGDVLEFLVHGLGDDLGRRYGATIWGDCFGASSVERLITRKRIILAFENAKIRFTIGSSKSFTASGLVIFRSPEEFLKKIKLFENFKIF